MSIDAIYVHAPFCRRRCGYCDFAVTVSSGAAPETWAGAVGAELRAVAAREGWALPLRPRTLYVGGGTPSLFGAAGMAALRDALEASLDFEGLREWTVEANPESFDSAVAAGWAAAGVDRLSLGAQTFHAPTLAWMGRLHGPDGPARALDAARAAGLENVSLDLIFGVPERLGRDWERDIDVACVLAPDHLSLYGLTAEPGTPLQRRVLEGRDRMPAAESYAAEYLAASRRLAADGWDHYEVSNFGRAGRRSLHNEAYWNGSAYLGLGPSAHSYARPRRWWNLRDWGAYRCAISKGEPAVEGEEVLSGAEARLERVWLGLRTVSGLHLPSPETTRVAGRWAEHGLAVLAGATEAGDDGHAGGVWSEDGAGAGRVRLTAEGWLLLDRLAVEMDAAWADGAEAAPAAAARSGDSA